MSTRANVIITKPSWNDKLYFYRHSDGYPEGTMPTLEKFMQLIKGGYIRDDMSQCAGWLIILGAIEYQTLTEGLFPEAVKVSYLRDNKIVDDVLNNFIPKDWKVGAYEPTTGLHGDIEHLYIIDLDRKEVYEEKEWGKWKL